ncbi:MAG: peptidase C69 [Candidatus Hodarchaeota archaeon]
MCDTYIALGNSTKYGNIIFGKNSDRLFDEVQLITYNPRMRYSKGDDLKTTHISIPQVTETAAVILSQPFWIWGAEMGANEYGVVIGNEAIATKEPLKDTGLLGMDIVRLGLERGKTAKEALDVVIDLLEKFGQGGAHHQSGTNYHNSMIIADPQNAYIIEMAGDWWIVENVKNFRSISNDISIRGKGDFRRDNIIQHAIENGYCKDDNDFDFAITFSSPQPLPNHIKCSMGQLSENNGQITPATMMENLREHEGIICRHRRNDFTAGSMVSSLKSKVERSIHWFTGSSLTCLSIFKPYIFPIEGQRVLEAKPYPEINLDWFWNRHKDFVKPFIRNPNKVKLEREDYIKKLRIIEQDLIVKVDNTISKGDQISTNDYIMQIKSINEEAWIKSKEVIT